MRGDSPGIGDFPMEYLQDHSGLPAGADSGVKFTPERKNEMYLLFEAGLFREEGDPLRVSYPADHPLAGELEEQMTILLREYKTDRQLLSPHAPEEPGAHDDAPTMCALGCLGAAAGKLGELVFFSPATPSPSADPAPRRWTGLPSRPARAVAATGRSRRLPSPGHRRAGASWCQTAEVPGD